MKDSALKESKRIKLKESILSTFADVNYPGDADIVSDHSGVYFDVVETEDAFRGKNWREVINVVFLRYHYDSLIFFSPSAYRYFLPAYLMVTLEDFPESDQIPMSIVFSIIGPPACKESGQPDPSEKFRLFSHFEKEVIKEWLCYFRDYYGGFDFGGKIASAIEMVNNFIS